MSEVVIIFCHPNLMEETRQSWKTTKSDAGTFKKHFIAAIDIFFKPEKQENFDQKPTLEK